MTLDPDQSRAYSYPRSPKDRNHNTYTKSMSVVMIGDIQYIYLLHLLDRWYSILLPTALWDCTMGLQVFMENVLSRSLYFYFMTAITVLSFLLFENNQWNLIDSSLNPYSSRSCLVASHFLPTPATPTLRPSFTVTTATPPGQRKGRKGCTSSRRLSRMSRLASQVNNLEFNKQV